MSHLNFNSRDWKETASIGQATTELILKKSSSHIDIAAHFNPQTLSLPSSSSQSLTLNPNYPKSTSARSNLLKRCAVKQVRDLDSQLLQDVDLTFHLRNRANFWSKSGERTRVKVFDARATQQLQADEEDKDRDKVQGDDGESVVADENENGKKVDKGKKRQLDEHQVAKENQADQEQSSTSLAIDAKKQKLDRMKFAEDSIPDAFRFHLHPDAMKRYYHTVSTKMTSTLARPTPLWEIKARWPYAPSSDSISPLPETSLQPHSSPRASNAIPDPSSNLASTSQIPIRATESSENKPILTIEIYSRTAVRLTRNSLEKQEQANRVWLSLEDRNRRSHMDKKLNAENEKKSIKSNKVDFNIEYLDEKGKDKSGKDGDDDDDENEDEDENINDDIRDPPPTHPYLYGPIYHSQTIETPSNVNFQDLLKSLVCTSETIPERVGWRIKLEEKLKEKEVKRQKEEKKLKRKRKIEKRLKLQKLKEEKEKEKRLGFQNGIQERESDFDTIINGTEDLRGSENELGLGMDDEEEEDDDDDDDDDSSSSDEEESIMALKRKLQNLERFPMNMNARYSGKKRKTGSCFMVEGRLYGDGPDGLGDEEDQGQQLNYAKLIHEHLTSSASKATNKDSSSTSIPSPRPLSSTSFETLPAPGFRINEPYWMLHQGDCEHYWVISSIRLPHQKIDQVSSYYPPANLPSNNDYLKSLPPIRATHLSGASVVRPITLYSRPTGNVDSTSVNLCTLCDTRSSKMMVIGGERFRSEQALKLAMKSKAGEDERTEPNGNSGSRGSQQMRNEFDDDDEQVNQNQDQIQGRVEKKRRKKSGVNGFFSHSEGLCEVCWADIVGSIASKGTQVEEADVEETTSKPTGKKKKGDLKRKFGPEGIFKPLQGESSRLERSEDMSDQSYMGYGKGMGGDGWTVIPVLE